MKSQTSVKLIHLLKATVPNSTCSHLHSTAAEAKQCPEHYALHSRLQITYIPHQPMLLPLTAYSRPLSKDELAMLGITDQTKHTHGLPCLLNVDEEREYAITKFQELHPSYADSNLMTTVKNQLDTIKAIHTTLTLPVGKITQTEETLSYIALDRLVNYQETMDSQLESLTAKNKDLLAILQKEKNPSIKAQLTPILQPTIHRTNYEVRHYALRPDTDQTAQPKIAN